MKMYQVSGQVENKSVGVVAVDIDCFPQKGPGVVVRLYDTNPIMGKLVIRKFYPDKEGYLHILFHHKEGTTARAYLKRLGLKVKKVIL